MLDVFQGKDTKDFDISKPVFPISVVANLLKVHQRTLRIYDEENLLSPSRSPKKRRLYSFSDVEKGKFIQYLTRELGINLAGVRIIVYLLSMQKINPASYKEHIGKVAGELNISLEAQEENRIKLSKRGRKPKNSVSEETD